MPGRPWTLLPRTTAAASRKPIDTTRMAINQRLSDAIDGIPGRIHALPVVMLFSIHAAGGGHPGGQAGITQDRHDGLSEVTGRVGDQNVLAAAIGEPFGADGGRDNRHAL